MVNLRIWNLVIVGVVAALLTTEVRADDKSRRETRARAALALAAAAKHAPTPSAIPAPRLVEVRDYAAGRNKAILDQTPLVVFVACESQKCPGAICSEVKGKTFGDVTGPAVVVGFPQGQSLFIDSTLSCPVSAGDLKKAIVAAGRKIDRPLAKPMPKAPAPATWKIDADDDLSFVGFRRRMPAPAQACPCGATCDCPGGVCPNCPTGSAIVSYPTKFSPATCANATCQTGAVSGTCSTCSGGSCSAPTGWYPGKFFGRRR